MADIYRIASYALAPFLPLWLEVRRLQGKEDAVRGHERLGHASLPRPRGTLLWIHAASVGEATSVLRFIELTKKQYPKLHILLTTGTVTSARLMQKRLPASVMHQYVPVDTPDATSCFMRHWRPDMALWVESEFWPNLIRSAHEWHCYMGVINARMSKKSFHSWSKRPHMIRNMLQVFNFVYAQSVEDANRLKQLGADPVECMGNLKYDAAPLGCNEETLIALGNITRDRQLFLAASTHPKEEALIERTHALLSINYKTLLTVIVPRHPQRGSQIAAALRKEHKVAQRSKQEPIKADTKFYIADTLGELGLFYRLCDTVFMGGSLVPHGGQNPLEAARLACAILTGPYMHNFSDVYKNLEEAQACVRAQDAGDLASQIDILFADNDKKTALQKNAKNWVNSQGGAAQKLLDALAPAFSVGMETT